MTETTTAHDQRLWRKYSYMLTTRHGCAIVARMMHSRSFRRLAAAYAHDSWPRIRRAIKAIREEHGAEVAEDFEDPC